ncbi:MAG: YcxB family protein [Dysgonamonadaceae bacterium]|jgi:hypothetical protein|nr:YcxB family protein [Dysgonamonadaceae bacterium]
MKKTIRFELSINDWIAFQEYYRSKKAPIYKFLMPALFISALLLIGLNVMYLHRHEASWFTITSGILLLFISYLFFLKGRSRSQWRKAALKMQAKYPDAFGPREMTFDDDGITIQTANNSKILSWKAIDRQEENKDYNFIFTQNGTVYIIPKSNDRQIPVNDNIQ